VISWYVEPVYEHCSIDLRFINRHLYENDAQRTGFRVSTVGDGYMAYSVQLRNYVLGLVVGFSVLLTGCETSDATLRKGGHSEAYIQGFHDGRHSGMKEAGNYLEHMVKDTRRFAEDPEYREGWLAGEDEGMRMQKEANAAVGGYHGYKIQKESEVDANAIGKDVMKDVDTKSLENLYK